MDGGIYHRRFRGYDFISKNLKKLSLVKSLFNQNTGLWSTTKNSTKQVIL